MMKTDDKTAAAHRASEDKPYRLASSIDESVWKVYGEDDQGQERYLGHITDKGDHYTAEGFCTVVEKAHGSLYGAAAALYEKCMEAGYLKKGHPNYLKGLG